MPDELLTNLDFFLFLGSVAGEEGRGQWLICCIYELEVFRLDDVNTLYYEIKRKFADYYNFMVFVLTCLSLF